MNGNSWHDNLQARAKQKTWRTKKRGEKCGEKRSETAVKNAVKHSEKKQMFGISNACFHFGLGALLATRFLDPFPQRSGSVSGSLSLSLSRSLRQPVVERKAAECAEGFHPHHLWCYSD